MNPSNRFLSAVLLSVLLFGFSCNNNEIENPIVQTDITGYVQKGPFNVGTSLFLSELDNSFTQTGKIFTTQVNSEDGAFSLKNILLTSNYVELKADGFYFNEISGKNSSAKLTLNAIADISDKKTLNVNVLTHLEKPRVEYLLSKGMNFKEAKAKAKKEVLAIFNLTGTENEESETLNITGSGADNTILLVLSSVLQGYRTVADVSELLFNIANDLKEDGTLDNAELQTKLVSHAIYIDTSKTINNLSAKYKELGTSIQSPEFGQYLSQFIENSDFKFESLVEYPEQTTFGMNVLNPNNSVFSTGWDKNYTFAANSTEGIGVKIELQLTEGIPAGSCWGYSLTAGNWKATNYDQQLHKQTFEVIVPGQTAELKLLFKSPGIKVRVTYIEGVREWTREITVN